jgi:shikimate kinase
MERILLVGFAGAGKSTVGRRLASRLKWQFFDTDTFIERKYHLTISDFFAKYGEEAFRICEQNAMRELLQMDHAVIATGGGMPCFFQNMDEMLEKAFVVYVQLSPQSLFLRLKNSHKERPLVAGKTDDQLLMYVEKGLREREVFYSRAHLTVKGENFSMDMLLEKLKDAGLSAGGQKE